MWQRGVAGASAVGRELQAAGKRSGRSQRRQAMTVTLGDTVPGPSKRGLRQTALRGRSTFRALRGTSKTQDDRVLHDDDLSNLKFTFIWDVCVRTGCVWQCCRGSDGRRSGLRTDTWACGFRRVGTRGTGDGELSEAGRGRRRVRELGGRPGGERKRPGARASEGGWVWRWGHCWGR